MNKKDILELKKRFKKDHCTFTKMCGCYVSGEKHEILKFRETFLNLEEDEYFKYLDIAKKVLSGTIDNNILELNFELNEELINEKQLSFMKLKNSQLKDDALLDELYTSIINNYDYTGNFLILLFHDAYDVMTKTSDNRKLDESEEVYEYILCAICPVSLSEPGLRYFEEGNEIKSRVRDWVVEMPSNGFVFPAFIDRSTNVNSVMYYTKNAKDTHPELMENVLGCPSKETNVIKKESFQMIIKDNFGADEKKADKIFMEVQDNLSALIEEHNVIYGDTDAEPIVLTQNDISALLVDSDIDETVSAKIEKSFASYFNDELPLAESLVDSKVLKANEQRKKEEFLVKQVESLQKKLDEVNNEVALENDSKELSFENTSTDVNIDNLENNVVDASNESTDLTPESNNYDVILKVKPEKVSQIKSQIIDGQKYIVIPVNDDEQATVNGVEDLI